MLNLSKITDFLKYSLKKTEKQCTWIKYLRLWCLLVSCDAVKTKKEENHFGNTFSL